MKGKQGIYLFLALLLPICIFLFLKFFGKNEFAVQPLYTSDAPPKIEGCAPPTLPYHVSPRVLDSISHEKSKLTLIVFGTPDKMANAQLQRVNEEFSGDHIPIVIITNDPMSQLKSCAFFLIHPFNVALIDEQRRIMGQYNLNDREDIDRLLTEITIILKKY